MTSHAQPSPKEHTPSITEKRFYSHTLTVLKISSAFHIFKMPRLTESPSCISAPLLLHFIECCTSATSEACDTTSQVLHGSSDKPPTNNSDGLQVKLQVSESSDPFPNAWSQLSSSPSYGQPPKLRNPGPFHTGIMQISSPTH